MLLGREQLLHADDERWATDDLQAPIDNVCQPFKRALIVFDPRLLYTLMQTLQVFCARFQAPPLADGGFIKPGRYLDYIDWTGRAYFSQEDGNVIKGIPHNRLLVSVLNAFGLDLNQFGNSEFTGGLPNLT